MKIQTYDLIVFSHLRWEFVTQRPQHIIGRLAEKRNILFVEEPVNYPTRIFNPHENITVLQPNAPSIDSSEFKDHVFSNIQRLTSARGRSAFGGNDLILWFYSASFVDVLDEIPHSLVVYDCMDELSLFRGAPMSLIRQEKRLLNAADIVFTGGKSLYEAKRALHPNVFCFPSSVDAKHFNKAYESTTSVPQSLRQVKHPVVGYIGVIDERIDLELLRKVAERLPHISFAMIGPAVKIKQDDLPKKSNIHYLGQQPYELLPNFLKGIDIAMMPFALNDATKFISPTKTLEFIASGKPIISTPIHDIVRDYSDVVKIVHDEHQFEIAINAFVNEAKQEFEHRHDTYENILQKTSWSQTARRMEEIINNTLQKNLELTISQIETFISPRSL